VTGDLARTGKPEQYGLVVELFKALMDRTGVPPERFFVVPGNHDVDRDVGRWLLRTLSSDEEAITFFEAAGSRGFHAQKLAAYRQSMKSLLGAARPLGIGVGEDSVEVVEIRGVRLAIAAFNSAWFAQGDDDKEKLWVGEANVMRAVDKIADEEAAFAIAMFHHPFSDLHPLDRELVERWCERGFDMVLRGHLHTDRTRSIATQRGGFVEVAAPAAYQGSKWGNGCFVGEIRAKARTVRLRPYMYTSGPDPWVLDTRVFPDDAEDGYCHTFAVPAKKRTKSSVGAPLRAATAAAMRSLPEEQQKAITRQVGGNSDQLASELSLVDVIRGINYLGNVDMRDSGLGWVVAITRAGDALDRAGHRIKVTDVHTLADALVAASRLFLEESARRKLTKDTYERTGCTAFTAAFAATVAGRVMPDQTLRDGLRSESADIILETMGQRVVIDIARAAEEVVHLNRLSRSIDLAGAKLGALVLLGPLAPPSDRSEITRAMSNADVPILIVRL